MTVYSTTSVTDRDSGRSAIPAGAAHAGDTCGNCGRAIHHDEPIRRCTFYRRNFAWLSAPVCADCWNNRPPIVWGERRRGDSFDLTTGRTAHHEDELGDRFGPCDGCGRLVAPPNRKAGQRYLLCSERCRAVVKARAKAEMDAMYPVTVTSTCAGCSTEFTPARADARYCSSACRQRAYRQRHTTEVTP